MVPIHEGEGVRARVLAKGSPHLLGGLRVGIKRGVRKNIGTSG